MYKIVFVSLAILLCSTMPSKHLHAETYEEMYKRVFGALPKKTYNPINVSLYIDGKEFGDMTIKVPSYGSDYRIPAPQLLDAIQENLVEGGLATLNARIVEDKLSAQDLEESGFNVILDRRAFTLNVKTPSKLRLKTTLSISGVTGAGIKARESFLVNPSKVSGYMNMFAFRNEEETNAGFSNEKNGLWQARFENVLNVYDWVSIADTRYQGTGGIETRRLQTIKDLPNIESRFTFMDLDAPSVGTLNNPGIAGVAFTSGPVLNPLRRSSPELLHRFYVQDPTTLLVKVNGRQIKVFELNGGRYELTDFPLQYGFNDIELQFTDNNGNTRTESFSFADDNSLYEIGLSEFSLGIGYPNVWKNSVPDINYTDPNVFTYFKRGLTPLLTGGTYFQGSMTQNLIGTEALVVTRLGPMELDYSQLVTESKIKGDRLAISTYTYPNIRPSLGPVYLDQIRAEIEYFDRYYVGWGQTKPHEYDLMGISGAFSFSGIGPYLLDTRFSTRFPANGEYDGEFYQLSNTLFRSFGLNLTAQASYTQTWGGNVLDPYVFRVSLNWRPRSNMKVAQTYDSSSEMLNTQATLSKTFREKYHTSNLLSVRGDNVQVGTDIQDGTNSYSGFIGKESDQQDIQLGYARRSEFGNVRAAYLSRDSNLHRTTQNQIGIDTGIAFAGWNAVLSSPIRENFAIVHAHESIKGYSLPVNEGKSTLTKYRSAIIPDLQRNQISNVVVDYGDLPLSLHLGNRLYKVKPGFYNGYAIEIKAEKRVIVMGKFVDENDEEMRLIRGEINKTGDPDFEPRRVISTRRGVFQLVDLTPGMYTINFGDEYEPVILKIPEVENGLFRAGKLVLSPQF
ncbi:MAG: hypothetical protein O3A01_01470 [bacterium]|nr:hypothetical protein [bacterium]